MVLTGAQIALGQSRDNRVQTWHSRRFCSSPELDQQAGEVFPERHADENSRPSHPAGNGGHDRK